MGHTLFKGVPPIIATDQIIDLLSAGVQGIHLYIMNNARVARRITENIKPILDRINGEDRS